MEKVAVVGMGLIGGSFYKASLRAGYETAALHHGDPGDFAGVGIVVVCLPYDAVAPWVTARAGRFEPGTIVVDAAGVKRPVMEALRGVPKGWHFVGGHPMAGREVSGYANSSADLFRGASMVLTPPEGTPDAVLARLRGFLRALGFGGSVVTSPENHDATIAFTSQLGHVAATAYARDPAMRGCGAYAGGSFADMTRIATQDAAAWASLYLANRDFLLATLDGFQGRLAEFRAALASGDAATLQRLIQEGDAAKRREMAGVAAS